MRTVDIMKCRALGVHDPRQEVHSYLQRMRHGSRYEHVRKCTPLARFCAALVAVALLSSFSYGKLDGRSVTTTPHPVHISSTQIDLADNERSLEVSVRMFTDDLEEALYAASSRRVRFGSTNVRTLDTLLGAYVTARLRVSPDGREATAKLLGHEREADAVLAFIEVPVNSVPLRVDVQSTLLLELFSDQSNIVHAKVNGRKRNALLRRGEERVSLSFN